VKALHAVPVVLAAAVTLTSVAAAGPDAAKQRVAITSQAAKTTEVSPAVFTPLQAGALKRDSGTLSGAIPADRVVMRGGQRVSIYDGVTTFKGKRGTLVTRYRAEYVDAGNGYHVGTGTWKVVRGTGQYARVTGGGRSGNVWLDRGPWSSRSEGFLTIRSALHVSKLADGAARADPLNHAG
jgi:hypothetical protein